MTDTVVFDLDGVLYLDSEAIPGAGAALKALEMRGAQCLFVTNNSTRAAEEVAVHITATVGHPVDPADVITSGMAAASYLQGKAEVVFVLGESGLEATLGGAGFAVTTEPEAADAVVVGLDKGLTYDRLRDAMVAVRLGARLVATNSDVTYPTARGEWPGGGAIVAAVEAATGETAAVCGKPWPPMRELVTARLRSERVWVVGDRPETDLALGRGAGWRTVLALSGVTNSAADVPPELAPDHVIATVADLPELMSAEQ